MKTLLHLELVQRISNTVLLKHIYDHVETEVPSFQN